MKIVVSDPKSGKSGQKELEAGKDIALFGKSIGEEVDGGYLGLEGYKMVITGGSDKDGTPMRKDILSTDRVSAFLSHGPGFKPERKGERKRKYLRGKTVGDHTVQVNLKVTTVGATPFEQIFPAKAKEEVKKE